MTTFWINEAEILTEILKGVWLNSECIETPSQVDSRGTRFKRPLASQRFSRKVSTIWLGDAVSGLLYLPFPERLAEALLTFAPCESGQRRLDWEQFNARMLPHVGVVYGGFRMCLLGSRKKRKYAPVVRHWRVEFVGETVS